jgi:FtsH-binding integral membrane protein
MQNQFDPRTTTGGYDPAVSVGVPRAARDAGLRSYMLKVYNYMASAVLLTGIVALMFSELGLWRTLINQETGSPSLFYWVAVFAPFALVMWLQVRIYHLSYGTAQALYWVYAASLGISLSIIFQVYTAASIAQTFFATAVAFGGLSLIGYTTKKDLSGWGTFLYMGIFGLVGAMLINLFMKSSTLDLAISAIGVVLFAAFTAYRTQDIKNDYLQLVGQGEALAKANLIGALHLYMAFINMFLFLLRFMGNRD